MKSSKSEKSSSKPTKSKSDGSKSPKTPKNGKRRSFRKKVSEPKDDSNGHVETLFSPRSTRPYAQASSTPMTTARSPRPYAQARPKADTPTLQASPPLSSPKDKPYSNGHAETFPSLVSTSVCAGFIYTHGDSQISTPLCTFSVEGRDPYFAGFATAFVSERQTTSFSRPELDRPKGPYSAKLASRYGRLRYVIHPGNLGLPL
jgi:hypothetical protein